MQRARVNICRKKDQCTFSNGETVTDLAAASPSVTICQSYTYGAVCERSLQFIISSFLNDFLHFLGGFWFCLVQMSYF